MPKAPTDTWRARVWAEFRVGNLTRAMRDTLLTLATYRGAGGVCWPSHATLAERARCCVRTVQRALELARDLGLVDWQHRRIRRGWRWLRTSNSYRLTTPSDELRPGQRRPAWRPFPTASATNGLNVRGGESKKEKGAFRAMLAEAAALPDLLAARQVAFVARQRAAMAG